MIKSLLGQRLDPLVHRLFPFLFTRPWNANALTICGALVSLAAAAVLAGGSLRLGGVLILAGGFFDLVDGVVARHQGTASRFGAFLDSTLDRLVDLVLLVGISTHFAAGGEVGHVVLSGAALTAGVLVSYTKARTEVDGPRVDVGIMERGERVVILALGALLDLLVPALWIVTIGSTITALQRIAFARQALDRLDRLESEGNEPTRRDHHGTQEESR